MTARSMKPGGYQGNAPGALVNPIAPKLQGFGIDPGTAGRMVADWITEGPKQRDALRTVQAANAYRSAYAEYEAGLDPASPSYTSDLEAWAKDNAPQFGADAGFETGAASDAYAIQAERFNGAAQLEAIGKAKGAIADQSITMRQEAETTVYNGIRNDPSQSDKLLAQHAETMAALNQAIPPHARAKLDRNFADGVVISTMEGMALQGDIEGARKFLRGATTLNPDTVRNSERWLDQQLAVKEQEKSKALTQQYVTYADRINAGQITDPSLFDRDEFRGLREENPGQWLNLREMARAQAKHLVAEERARANAYEQARLGYGSMYTAEGSNKVWKQTVADLGGPEADADQYSQAVIQHVSAFGQVPAEVKGRLERVNVLNDPAQLVQYYPLYLAMHEHFPAADVGESAKTFSEMAAYQERYGIPAQQAAERVIADRAVPVEVRRQRETDFKDASKAVKFDARPALAKSLGYDSPAEVPADLVANYDGAVRDSFMRNGDIKAAMAAGHEYIKARYAPGPTVIGGAERQAPFPPEAIILQNNPGMRAYAADIGVAVNNELQTLLKAAGIKPFSATAGQEWDVTDGYPPFRLTATPQTIEEIRSGAKAPEYQIEIRAAHGYEPLPRQGGGYLTYQLPTGPELQAMPEIKARLDEGMARARAVQGVERAKGAPGSTSMGGRGSTAGLGGKQGTIREVRPGGSPRTAVPADRSKAKATPLTDMLGRAWEALTEVPPDPNEVK